MGYVSVKVHNSALRIIQLLMCLALIVPPRPYPQLRLLYTGAMLVYLGLIFRWRIAFNYTVDYDRLNDPLSYVLDLVNFMALVVSHMVVSFELIWQNRSNQIEKQFSHIQHVLCERTGHKLNTRSNRLKTNIVFILLLLRVLMLLGTTVYNNSRANTSLLLISNFYSQIVLILRCNEFTLHSAFVLTIYQELHDAASSVILKLESSRYETWSLRRLALKHIATLQQLHLLLWQIQRDIERNFERSLVMLMLKYFIDTSVLPYWAYVKKIHTNNVPMQIWCLTEELGILLEISIPCWFWTRCEQLQRKFRAVFHVISVDRRNEQLNTALLRISAQLGQESCQFRVGGLVPINNNMLGKFLFGVLSYTLICIQFWITYTVKTRGDAEVDETSVEQSRLNKTHTS
ncbi:putative gustatory receptor 98a [Drosophila hydei]|uniref:Gustatory receptor n=1 Tax=Drosophila hydei TaxID=7224 RepID=A0A6J1LBP9_DROHY|nr:putative gustatory receptor 98a [Drosophila hydei]